MQHGPRSQLCRFEASFQQTRFRFSSGLQNNWLTGGGNDRVCIWVWLFAYTCNGLGDKMVARCCAHSLADGSSHFSLSVLCTMILP